MTLSCDFLKVVATRVGDKAATLGKYGKFKYMLATGHVKMTQGDRVATSGRAEMFPEEDRVVLTEKPVVKIESEHYEASGPRMILYRGQRRAVIEGAAPTSSFRRSRTSASRRHARGGTGHEAPEIRWEPPRSSPRASRRPTGPARSSTGWT